MRFAIYILVTLFSFMAFAAAVDLNLASVKELEAVPGIGPKIAQEIVAARPFKSIEELKKIKGIGEVRYPQIAPLVMVEAASPTNTKVTTPVSQRKPLIAGEQININNASLDELQRLPGIGPAKAQEIIKARPFRAAEDILRVKGIAPASFEKIKNYIYVK